MLDLGWCGEEGADNAAPLGECLGTTEIHRMVFEGVPENHQYIALGRLNTLVDFVAAEALGFANDVSNAMDDGGVEFGLLAGLDVDISEFEDHGSHSGRLLSVCSLSHY
jgi:hypothetical protein